MRFFSTAFETSGHSGLTVFSEQQAEMDLVRNLFSNTCFQKRELRFLFSKYPIVTLSEKGHIICKIMELLWPGKTGEKQFKLFGEFENFLLAIGNRGHFVHQFLVYLIGLNIIQILLDKYPSEKEREELFGFKDENLIFDTWLMAASAHDFGYPYEFAIEISERLSGLYGKFHMSHLSEQFGLLKAQPMDLKKEYIISLNGARIDVGLLLQEVIQSSLDVSNERATKVQKHLENAKDHGYVSSIIICRTVLGAYLKETDWASFRNDEIYRSLQYAMGAIALHNLREKEYQKQIAFSKNAYAYLLFMLDNIQDWSRVFTRMKKWPTYQLVQFTRNDYQGEISLDYYLRSDSWPDGMKERVDNSLKEKEATVNTLSGAGKPLGITIGVRYHMIKQDKPTEIKHSFRRSDGL